MIIPCEIAVKSVIPSMKALIANELMEKHGLKQDEVAELLGISQSAVSKYAHKVRGYVVKVDDAEEIVPLVKSMINLLLNEDCQREEFLGFFCQTCKAIRRKRLMCQFCGKTDSTIEIGECDFCSTYSK